MHSQDPSLSTRFVLVWISLIAASIASRCLISSSLLSLLDSSASMSLLEVSVMSRSSANQASVSGDGVKQTDKWSPSYSLAFVTAPRSDRIWSAVKELAFAAGGQLDFLNIFTSDSCTEFEQLHWRFIYRWRQELIAGFLKIFFREINLLLLIKLDDKIIRKWVSLGRYFFY